MELKLKDLTFCSFDIETSGAYPLSSEICEVAAIKWKNGEIIGKYQSLIKVNQPMSDFIIGIHGITNEMLKDAPSIQTEIHNFYDFISDSYCVAHHAPFDLGFLAIEMEKEKIIPLENQVFCTSLLARKLFPDSVNHKLQTLVGYFDFTKNNAHRALDDSQMCLNVFLKCCEKVGWDSTLQDLQKEQSKKIFWKNYYLQEILENPNWNSFVEAIQKNIPTVIEFKSYGRLISETIQPLGLVRNPDGDFIFAYSQKEKKTKRYYLDKILNSEIQYP